jgi:rfaE bifunctional protein nucleotidyltransferase chain/domain
MDHLITAQHCAALGKEFRREERRLVLTNGCFDLLHIGHVRYLEQARALGDALIVAVNSDRSVQELKGPKRPLNPAEDRAEVLASLRCVDYVTIFDDLRVTRVIEELRPSIYAKGGDYTPESLDRGEQAALNECGARVIILPLTPGRSTTRFMKQLIS